MNIEKVSLLLIAAVFPLGQLVRIAFLGFPGITFHPLDFLVFVFNILWVVKEVRERKKFIFPPVFKEMVVFGGYALFSLMININKYSVSENVIGLFYLLRLMNYFVFYPALLTFLKKSYSPVLKVLFYEGILIGAIAFIQYLVIPDTRFLYFLGWDEHYYRAIGSFLDPAFTGIILVLAFLVLLHLYTKKTIKNITTIIGGIIVVIPLALTFSRISYAIFLLLLVFSLLIKKRFKYLMVGLAGFLLLVLLLPKPTGEGVDLLRTSSFFRRSDNYREAAVVIKDNFWLGIGFNRYRPALKKYGFNLENRWGESHSGAGADNSFLLVMATTGIIGLTFYLNILRAIGQECLKQIKKKNYLLFLSTVSIVLFSFVSNGLFYPWLLIWLMTVLAWSTAEN